VEVDGLAADCDGAVSAEGTGYTEGLSIIDRSGGHAVKIDGGACWVGGREGTVGLGALVVAVDTLAGSVQESERRRPILVLLVAIMQLCGGVGGVGGGGGTASMIGNRYGTCSVSVMPSSSVAVIVTKPDSPQRAACGTPSIVKTVLLQSSAHRHAYSSTQAVIAVRAAASHTASEYPGQVLSHLYSSACSGHLPR